MLFLKRFFEFVLCLSLSGIAVAQNYNKVHDKLDSLVNNCLPQGTDVALMVYDMTADTAVYALREQVMCRPASVQKVLTSAVALSALGPDFNFETRLEMRGDILKDSTLTGDIWLVGGLDPALSEDNLKQMVRDLKAAGVKYIRGTVYADVTMMDSVCWGPGWCWDDAPSSFQPFISALTVHGGYVGVQVTPGSKAEPGIVTLYPSNKVIRVDNKSVSKDESAGPLSIERNWIRGDNTIVVTGNANRRESTDISVRSSLEFTFQLFLEYLSDAGISYRRSGYGVCPTMTQNLSVSRHSLQQVMKQALKESDNLYAECMFLRSGKLSCTGPVSFTLAAKYTEQFIGRKFGMNPSAYHIVDGSGLSMYDFLSPAFLVDILRLIYSKPDMYSFIYPLLPISGIDGTLKGRMSDRSTLGKVHAKTGSVTGACTLAGYVRTASGHDLAFSIMNSGTIKAAGARNIQDKICTVLCEL